MQRIVYCDFSRKIGWNDRQRDTILAEVVEIDTWTKVYAVIKTNKGHAVLKTSNIFVFLHHGIQVDGSVLYIVAVENGCIRKQSAIRLCVGKLYVLTSLECRKELITFTTGEKTTRKLFYFTVKLSGVFFVELAVAIDGNLTLFAIRGLGGIPLYSGCLNNCPQKLPPAG